MITSASILDAYYSSSESKVPLYEIEEVYEVEMIHIKLNPLKVQKIYYSKNAEIFFRSQFYTSIDVSVTNPPPEQHS